MPGLREPLVLVGNEAARHGLDRSRSPSRRAPEAGEADAAGAVLAGDKSEWAGYSPVRSIKAKGGAWRSGRPIQTTT